MTWRRLRHAISARPVTTRRGRTLNGPSLLGTILIGLALAGGCQPVPRPSLPAPSLESGASLYDRDALRKAADQFAPIEGREFYLCCNMRFNANHEASDANYAYPEAGTMLAAGTKLKITSVSLRSIAFQLEGQSATYSLDFRFGTKALSAKAYFLQYILREADPTTALLTWTPRIVEAVRAGRVVNGMTREQTLMARGYPPFHRTAGIDADVWIYYHTRVLVDRVRFVDGKVAAVFRRPAPE
jgi:hypothetical protein